jgi:type I restriction enzyme, S subunit
MNFVPLCEAADVQMGTAPPGTSYNESERGIPMIAGAGDYGEEYPEPKKWTTEPTRVASKGDLIVCVRATIGDLNWADKDYCLGRGVAGVRAKADVADIKYLAHFISSQKRELTKLGTGSTFLAIRRDDLKYLPIPLPPLEEQKRIAAILDKADAIRRKRQQAIELADQFLRSVFLDMFGDPVTNPKGFEIVDLSSLCHKVTDGTHHSPKPQLEGVPYITAKHVKPNRLDFYKNPTFISQEAHEEIFARCAPAKGDVLYIKDGATTGAAAINHYEFQFSMLSSLALIKPQVERLLPEYLCDWLNFPANKDRIIRNVSGAAITRLTISKIKDIPIELPSILLQQSYAETRKKVLSQVVKLEEGVSSSNRLFHSLSQQAFKGELIQNKVA